MRILETLFKSPTRYRVPEEFYDYENDPYALENLIDQERHTGKN